MKEYIWALCLAMLLLCNCTSTIGDELVVTLPKEIKDDYPILSLDMFFSGQSVNDIILCREKGEPISIDKVERQYPALLTRYKDNLGFPFQQHQPLYSILRVSEGGYYYLFWVKSFQNGISTTVLGFFAYINWTNTVDAKRIEGMEAIRDVLTVNPYLQINTSMSSQTSCYIFSDAANIVEIECIIENSVNPSYYRIKEVKLKPRKESSSYFALLEDYDLP